VFGEQLRRMVSGGGNRCAHHKEGRTSYLGGNAENNRPLTKRGPGNSEETRRKALGEKRLPSPSTPIYHKTPTRDYLGGRGTPLKPERPRVKGSSFLHTGPKEYVIL